jgi:lysophospholipase L1-like esterase
MSEKSLKKGKLFSLALSAALPFFASAAQVEPFAAGERVVVLGDSITHGGSYVGNLQLFQCLRNPGCGTLFMSAGLSGDTAGGCLGRFSRDVAEKSPDRVFVMFGMNDVGHNLYTKDAAKMKDLQAKREGVFKRYEANMNKVHDLIAKTGARAVYITPTPYDEYATNLKKVANKDCNEYGLFTLAGIVRKLAGEKNTAFVELYKPFTELVKKHPGRFHADRVHPGAEGHLIMTAMIFEQAGNSPIVGKCEIDACELPYKYEPKAFPLPLGDLYRKAEEVYPLTEKLNREMLVIKGLKPGTWTLCADGKALGDFTSEALASGVNIAVLPTPGQLEAQKLAKVAGGITAGMSRMCTFFAMFDRVKKCGGDPENRESAFSALDKWVAGLYSNKVSTATYYSNCAKSFKKTFDERAAIEKQIEDKRAELNAARPKPYVISVRAAR